MNNGINVSLGQSCMLTKGNEVQNNEYFLPPPPPPKKELHVKWSSPYKSKALRVMDTNKKRDNFGFLLTQI